MEYIKALEALLMAYPQWDGVPLQIDSTGPESISCGLFPLGVEELSRREDVTGKVQLRLRQKFLLRRVCPRGPEASQWLLQLQAWLTGKALGRNCILRAEGGRLAKANPAGNDIYELTLTAEYTKENISDEN